MTMEAGGQLERELAALTQWGGGKTALWKQALRAVGGAKGRAAGGESFWWRLVTLRLSKVSMLLAGASCVFVVSAAITAARFTGVTRDSAEAVATKAELNRQINGMSAGLEASVEEYPAQYDSLVGRDLLGYDPQRSWVGPPARSAPGEYWDLVRDSGSTPTQFNAPSTTNVPDGAATAASNYAFQRYVIRNATIQLKTDNVRAAFARVQHLVQPAAGEYVEQSSLAGEGARQTGTLTLRVAAGRLGDVLNQLRELGTVISEQQGGQDVTGQAVDLEARLRNEVRVETELLALLESRKEAPLKEVLELRESLGRVRTEIERLTGQRDHLARLVSLASVLVILTAEDAVEVAPAEGVMAYFGEELGRAWRAGVYFLADTLTLMVRIFVGGAVFWVVLAAVVVMVKRRRRAG